MAWRVGLARRTVNRFCIPINDVVDINRSLPGIVHAVLDSSKLEGAVARPLHTGYGQQLYPTLFERAAALLDGLARCHAFQDGNKRTAWICTSLYLSSEGAPLVSIPDADAADLVVGLVVGQVSVIQAAEWLLERSDLT